MNHLMIDLINVYEKQSSPLCAIEAVFFEPSTGQIGKTFYSSIDIRKAQSLKGRLSIQTAFDWMKKDPHWRAEVMSATAAEEGVLCDLAGFIADNTQPRMQRYLSGSKIPRKSWFRCAMPRIAQRCLAFSLKVQNSAVSALFSILPHARAMRHTRGTRWCVTRSQTRSIKRSKYAKSGSA